MIAMCWNQRSLLRESGGTGRPFGRQESVNSINSSPSRNRARSHPQAEHAFQVLVSDRHRTSDSETFSNDSTFVVELDRTVEIGDGEADRIDRRDQRRPFASASDTRKREREKEIRRGTLVHPFDQMVADAERVRHDRQRRIHGRARGEEAAVDDVQIVDLVRLAVDIQSRGFRVVPEANGPVLMRDAGQGNAVADEQIAREEPLVALVAVNWARGLLLHQLLQLAVQPLVALFVVRLVVSTMLPLRSRVTRLSGSGRSSDVSQKSSE